MGGIMAQHIADPTFNIKAQVLAVMQLLAQRGPAFANYNKKYGDYRVYFETKPWYNGRERGLVITMGPRLIGGPYLHIAVFEHRNSDQLCTLRWETEHNYWNHPLEDPEIFEKAYHGKTKYDTAASFGCGEIGKCADWVYGEFEDFYLENKKKLEDKGEEVCQAK